MRRGDDIACVTMSKSIKMPGHCHTGLFGSWEGTRGDDIEAIEKVRRYKQNVLVRLPFRRWGEEAAAGAPIELTTASDNAGDSCPE